MEKIMEAIKICFIGLWNENIISVLFTAISTMLQFVGRMDWTKNNKGYALFVWFIQIILNVPCVFFSDADWMTKIYGSLLMVAGIIEFCAVAKMKVPKTTTLHLDDLGMPDQIAVFDNREMFNKAVEGAKRGEPMYICNLGLFYRNGTGTGVNLKKSQEYFQILSEHPDPFWREEGRKELEITNRMINEKYADMKKIIKDGTVDCTKDFFGME